MQRFWSDLGKWSLGLAAVRMVLYQLKVLTGSSFFIVTAPDFEYYIIAFALGYFGMQWASSCSSKITDDKYY